MKTKALGVTALLISAITAVGCKSRTMELDSSLESEGAKNASVSDALVDKLFYQALQDDEIPTLNFKSKDRVLDDGRSIAFGGPVEERPYRFLPEKSTLLIAFGEVVHLYHVSKDLDLIVHWQHGSAYVEATKKQQIWLSQEEIQLATTIAERRGLGMAEAPDGSCKGYFYTLQSTKDDENTTPRWFAGDQIKSLASIPGVTRRELGQLSEWFTRLNVKPMERLSGTLQQRRVTVGIKSCESGPMEGFVIFQKSEIPQL